MSQSSFILADPVRADQFGMVGSGRRLLQNSNRIWWRDGEGVTWAAQRIGDHYFAVTWLGPGAYFDPYARSRYQADYEARLAAMRAADDRRHIHELAQACLRVPSGGRVERVLWAIQWKVLHEKTSVVSLADFELAGAVWGRQRSRWPRHWRSALAAILQGVSWLHLACLEGELPPAFGAPTALLTHAADLRGGPQDICQASCPGLHGDLHHHYLVNIGRGFLGSLEQFGQTDELLAVRTYSFPTGDSQSPSPTLWRAGKHGALVSVYLPGKLGYPGTVSQFTAGQHRLLQTLVRETTRRKRSRRTAPSLAEVLRGNRVPDAAGKGMIECPMLVATAEYVVFGGNKKRKGCGYRLTTPGGWLKKAGYEQTKISDFLGDLEYLADRLNLTVVGLLPSTHQWFDMGRMRAMAVSTAWRPVLERLHVRVYGPADYVERWNGVFDWLDAPPTEAGTLSRSVLGLAAALGRYGVTKRALARGIGMDPSLVGKILSGKRRCPHGFLDRSYERLEGQEGRSSEVVVPASYGVAAGSILAPALEYLRRGWSVSRRGSHRSAIGGWKW